MDSRETQNMELIRISFGREHYHLQNDMINWCEKHLGPGLWNQAIGNNKWSVESMFGYTHFHFNDSKDAVLFTLKWR